MAKNRIWIIIISAVALYLVMGIYADFGKLLSSIGVFDWALIPIMIFLVTLSYLVRFCKWNFFLKHVGVNLTLKDNLFVFFSGLAMIITPAKAGEIWKGWLIKEINGESLSKTVPVVIVDRMTDVVGLVILSLCGVLYYRSSIYVLGILFIIFLAFILVIRSKRASERLISLLEGRARKYGVSIKEMHETFLKTIQTPILVGMSFLSVVAWFLECLVLYAILTGFQQSLSLLLSTFVYSFSSLAGAVSMIPGGLGVAEASISGFLILFGIQPDAAIGTAIIVRFGTLWYGAILGLMVYLLFKNSIQMKRIE